MEQKIIGLASMVDFTTTLNKCSKKKIKTENGEILTPKRSHKKGGGQVLITDCYKAEKRKIDRFNGISEEELYTRSLPDHLAPNLDILIIGINPGLFAASRGHHYAGPGNHFWKCIYLSGLIPEPMTALDDYKLIQHGIGFTNIVQRTTRGSADLKSQEIKDGAKILLEKIRKYRPKIAVFNGKEIYRIFSSKKDFGFGRQPVPIDGTQTLIYVMPSSSARCSQLPRAIDKVPFYVALRKLRDHLCGRLAYLSDQEVTFSSVLVTAPRKSGQPLSLDNDNNNNLNKANVRKVQSKIVKTEIIDNGLADDERMSSLNGVDDDGRPTILGPNSAFNLRLIKKEILNDANDDDDKMVSGNVALMSARERAADVADLNSLLDKSAAFLFGLDADYSDTPNNGGGFNNNGLTIFQPNLLYSQFFPSQRLNSTSLVAPIDGVGGGNIIDDKHKRTNVAKGSVEPSEGDDGDNDGGSQQPYQNGSKNESTAANSNNNGGQLLATADSSGSLNAQVPNAAVVQQQASNRNLLGASSIDHHHQGVAAMQQLAQQINGGGQSLPSQIKSEPVHNQQQRNPQSHHATPATHTPRPCNLPPEIELHVEQAIETVVQRAREGPLEMPAFRTPAEKSAAAHAHQQQQQQQQMIANIQLQAAAHAAAMQHSFGGMKAANAASVVDSVGGTAALLGGIGNFEQSCQSASSAANVAAAAAAAATPNLYSQYFQQPQANQSSFPSAAGFGTSSVVGYGSPQWTFTTATSGGNNAAVMYNHPTANIMAAAAPYFQNAAAFSGQQLYHQSGGGSAGGSSSGGAGGLPFSPTAAAAGSYFNQQQAAAAAAVQQQQSMYGGYPAGSGFNMQQSPHNL